MCVTEGCNVVVLCLVILLLTLAVHFLSIIIQAFELFDTDGSGNPSSFLSRSMV